MVKLDVNMEENVDLSGLGPSERLRYFLNVAKRQNPPQDTFSPNAKTKVSEKKVHFSLDTEYETMTNSERQKKFDALLAKRGRGRGTPVTNIINDNKIHSNTNLDFSPTLSKVTEQNSKAQLSACIPTNAEATSAVGEKRVRFSFDAKKYDSMTDSERQEKFDALLAKRGRGRGRPTKMIDDHSTNLVFFPTLSKVTEQNSWCATDEEFHQPRNTSADNRYSAHQRPFCEITNMTSKAQLATCISPNADATSAVGKRVPFNLDTEKYDSTTDSLEDKVRALLAKRGRGRGRPTKMIDDHSTKLVFFPTLSKVTEQNSWCATDEEFHQPRNTSADNRYSAHQLPFSEITNMTSKAQLATCISPNADATSTVGKRVHFNLDREKDDSMRDSLEDKVRALLAKRGRGRGRPTKMIDDHSTNLVFFPTLSKVTEQNCWCAMDEEFHEPRNTSADNRYSAHQRPFCEITSMTSKAQLATCISPNADATSTVGKRVHFNLDTKKDDSMRDSLEDKVRALLAKRGRGRPMMKMIEFHEPRIISADNRFSAQQLPFCEITTMTSKAQLAACAEEDSGKTITSNESTAEQPTQQTSDRPNKVRGEIQKSTETSKASKKVILSKYFGPQNLTNVNAHEKEPLRQNRGTNRLDSQGYIIKQEEIRSIDEAPKEDQKPNDDDILDLTLTDEMVEALYKMGCGPTIVDPEEVYAKDRTEPLRQNHGTNRLDSLGYIIKQEEITRTVDEAPNENQKPNRKDSSVISEPTDRPHFDNIKLSNSNEDKSLWFVLENLKGQLTPKK